MTDGPVVDALDRLTAGLTPVAKRKLWHDNAQRFYRLPANPHI